MEQALNKIIFDFDRTLFNTEKLLKIMRRVTYAYGLTDDDELHIRKELVFGGQKSNLNLESYIAAMRKHAKKDTKFGDKEAREVINIIQNISENFLLHGAYELLTFCDKQRMEKYLVTLGEIGWQKKKIAMAEISIFFDAGHILLTDDTDTTKGKMTFIQNILLENHTGKGVCLVNDRTEELEIFLKNFSKAIVFGRYDRTNKKSHKEEFSRLQKEYPERFFWSEDLSALQKNLEQLLKK